MTNFVSLVGLFLLLSTVDLSVQDKGSTPRIKEMVVGRCYDYQYKKFGLNATTWKNCSKIWNALHGAFAYKNPCSLTFADYKPYFDEVGMADIYNKSLFWSGTYKAVHSYSEFDVRFTTLEDTMAGWIVNELTFCGMRNLSRNTTDGIDYDSCPKWSKNCDYTTPFWGQASKIFAEHARGIVRVMVNGSRVSDDGNHIPAYKRESFFGKYELPSFYVEKITELMITVIHTINRTEYERCGERSIKELQEDAKGRGISVSCHDDPENSTFLDVCDSSLGGSTEPPEPPLDPPQQDKGSTPRIKEIIVGRCYDYQYKKFGLNATTWKNCSKIWNALHGAFAYKNPCSLTFADYKPYFDEVGMEEIYNKSLFWSGTYRAVHSYSEFDVRFTTLEDTMAGWIVNELSFCGNEILSRSTTDGIDYDSCPKWSPSCDYTTPFWGQASKIFAEHARGIVRVMVNGSRVSDDGNHIPAYSRESFFGKYELPNFQVEKITELMIIVVHTINGTKYERCGKGSVKLLEGDAKGRGIKVSCHDDPSDVLHILCVDHPFSRECLFLEEADILYRNRTRLIIIFRTRYVIAVGLAMSVQASLLLIIASCVMAAGFNAGHFN